MYEYLDNSDSVKVIGSFSHDKNSDFKDNVKHLLESFQSSYQMDAITDISKIGIYGLAYKENVDDTRESPTLQLLERMDEHLAFGVKVYDPFIKERMVDHQFMNFEDFLNEIEILVIITAHDHIKNNLDLVKDKLILDTKNICNFDGVYKL